MEAVINDLLTNPLTMLLFGMATHFLKKLVQFRVDHQSEGKYVFCPTVYFRMYPYQTLLSLVGGLAGYAALIASGELSLISAYTVGYMADSAADVIGGRSMKST